MVENQRPLPEMLKQNGRGRKILGFSKKLIHFGWVMERLKKEWIQEPKPFEFGRISNGELLGL